MKRFVVDVPDDLAEQVEPYQDRLTEVLQLGIKQLRIHEALSLYEQGLISIGRVVELSELSREEVTHQAQALGIRPRWSEEMAHEELA